MNVESRCTAQQYSLAQCFWAPAAVDCIAHRSSRCLLLWSFILLGDPSCCYIKSKDFAVHTSIDWRTYIIDIVWVFELLSFFLVNSNNNNKKGGLIPDLWLIISVYVKPVNCLSVEMGFIGLFGHEVSVKVLIFYCTLTCCWFCLMQKLYLYYLHVKCFYNPSPILILNCKTVTLRNLAQVMLLLQTCRFPELFPRSWLRVVQLVHFYTYCCTSDSAEFAGFRALLYLCYCDVLLFFRKTDDVK